jgi:hypothetical protein
MQTVKRSICLCMRTFQIPYAISASQEMIDDSTEALKSVKQRDPFIPARRLARQRRLEHFQTSAHFRAINEAAHAILPKIDAVMQVFTMKYHQSQTTRSDAAALLYPAACAKADDIPITVARRSVSGIFSQCNPHSRAPAVVVKIRPHLNHAILPQTTQHRQATTPSERKA